MAKKKKLTIEELKRKAPLLKDLHNHSFEKHLLIFCENCGNFVLHEIYRGHDFAEGLDMTNCLNCGYRGTL